MNPDLAPARGIIYATLLSLPIWGVIGLLLAVAFR